MLKLFLLIFSLGLINQLSPKFTFYSKTQDKVVPDKKNIKFEVANLTETIKAPKNNSMEGKVLKTPISLLLELMVKRGKLPKYDQVETANDAFFTFRVSVDDESGKSYQRAQILNYFHLCHQFFSLSADGTGTNKKSAKQAAAKALLDKLAGVTISEDFYYKTRSNESEISSNEKSSVLKPTKAPVSDHFTTNSKLSCDDDLDLIRSKKILRSMKNVQLGDYVGALQNFSRSCNVEGPLYELIAEFGQDHEKNFTVNCSFQGLESNGTGKSFKVGKRNAAQIMWNIVLEKFQLEN